MLFGHATQQVANAVVHGCDGVREDRDRHHVGYGSAGVRMEKILMCEEGRMA